MFKSKAKQPRFLKVLIADEANRAFLKAKLGGAVDVDLIIVRDYECPNRCGWAQELVRFGHARRIPVMVARDGRLADVVGADGCHFPEKLMRQSLWWRYQHRHWYLSASAHTEYAVAQANRLPLDFLLVSPVFRTQSHEGGRPLGFMVLRKLVQKSRCPVIALGGISHKNINSLLNTGVEGAAMIRGVISR
ncbi:MAG: thiamine phosphate synthase [Alphaproteobacteria bacterium]|nr:thiamine phosphate synthase [Alphaproteobacteria bacterium]